MLCAYVRIATEHTYTYTVRSVHPPQLGGLTPAARLFSGASSSPLHHAKKGETSVDPCIRKGHFTCRCTWKKNGKTLPNPLGRLPYIFLVQPLFFLVPNSTYPTHTSSVWCVDEREGNPLNRSFPILVSRTAIVPWNGNWPSFPFGQVRHLISRIWYRSCPCT